MVLFSVSGGSTAAAASAETLIALKADSSISDVDHLIVYEAHRPEEPSSPDAPQLKSASPSAAPDCEFEFNVGAEGATRTVTVENSILSFKSGVTGLLSLFVAHARYW